MARSMATSVSAALAVAMAACTPDVTFESPDAGLDATAANDAADAGDAADEGGPTKTVSCHSVPLSDCVVGRQACCGVFANVEDYCVAIPDDAGKCAAADASVALIECDEPSDCPAGTVCCAFDLDLNAPPSGKYTAIRCASACAAPNGVECGVNLPGHGPVASACTGGTTCSGQIDNYYFCR